MFKMRHIDYAIPAAGHTPMYVMHKFWARKPHNVVAEYIHAYSNPGDIVLDPFAGSGVTAGEALHLGRRTVAIDSNPMSAFVTWATLVPVDVKELENAFETIRENCEDRIRELYATTCAKCGKDAQVLATIWLLGEKHPLKLRYKCSSCGAIEKQPSALDNKLATSRIKIPFWHPTFELSYGADEFKEGTHIQDVQRVDQLFTNRNLYALAYIYEEIEKIGDQKTKDLMKFAFTSRSHVASRMCPVRKSRQYSSFWPVQRYWIPKKSMERNVWMIFESAVFGRQGLIKGKKNSQKWYDGKEKYVVIGKNGGQGLRKASRPGLEGIVEECTPLQWKESQSFSKLGTIFIKQHSALELVNERFPSKSMVPAESIDYCFTDPPYGGSIQYYELTQLWLSWLRGKSDDKRFVSDWKNEITINSGQKKSFNEYDADLNEAFRQIHRILKSGKYMTVTFNNTDIKIRNSLIRAAVYAGFDMEKIVYQTPARASAKSLLQPYGSAIGDYYIRFRKPKSAQVKTREQADEATQERIVVESVRKILAERGEPTAYPWIINRIDTELAQRGYSLVRNPKGINSILKSHLGNEFVLVDSPDGPGKRWFLKNPSEIAYLESVPLDERVETAVVDVLRRRRVVYFDDILREIFIKFPNSLTPETHSIKYVLEQYACAAGNGKWRLKGEVNERESQHTEMIETLVALGKKLGYEKIWAAHRSKGTKGVAESSLNLPIDKDKLKRVREIDVLWIDNDKVKYEFEVENTTAITEAINRGSNIDYECKRIIVVPEERADFVRRRLKEPLLADNWKRYGWKILFYDQLRKAVEKSSNLEKLMKVL
jgi:DNA modification methylase